MEFISPILGWVPKYLMDPISMRAWFRVLRKLKENIEDLEKATDKLDARKDDEQRKLEAAKNIGVEASAEANVWFRQVKDSVSISRSLRTKYDDQQQRRGPCPNCCFCLSRYQLSRRALKLKVGVERLHNEDPKSGWIGVPTRQKGKKMDTVSLEGQRDTEKLKQEIIDSLLDDRYVVVGLYGMGGVGKTTLLQHANEHFRNTAHFESVIFITVSSTPDFEEIRKQIANCLGLDTLQPDNDLKREMSRILETRKYVMILDDLWQPITELGEICISVPNKENGCKILMASRSKQVVTRFAIRFAAKSSLRVIQVNTLGTDEAWNLFVQKVGEDIISKPEIEPLAKEVLRKCDGLPLALVVVGSTMSTQETEGEWKDALRELKQSASNIEDIEEAVFSKLMFSFEKLEPIEQSLFLYCGLFPEDHVFYHYDKLLNFAIGEEALCRMHTFQDIRNKVTVLVEKLKNSSMVEDAGFGRSIKMHNVMRELAKWITSPMSKYNYSKFIVNARARKNEAPDAIDWCRATKISLMESREMETLPQLTEQCPQLHTLLLGKCSLMKDIPQVQFLEDMPALQILNLSFCTRLEYLPHSISHLVNLRLLRLTYCLELQELPPEIGMLFQLIWLDLDDCQKLRNLPVEMKKLNNLRHLNIRNTLGLKSMPSGMLSGMHKLEELHTEVSGLKWHTSDLEDLSQLTCLTLFGIRELREVKVSHWLKTLYKTMGISLHLQKCDMDPLALCDDDLLEDDPRFNVRRMSFTSCRGLISVPTHGYASLTIKCCPDLEALLSIDEAAVGKINGFEGLYELELERLDKLETICRGRFPPQEPLRGSCFSNLSRLTIKGCPDLKVIFTEGVIKLLKKLRMLRVYRCVQLENLVVSNDEDDMDISAFPSLKEIYLCELPELTTIWRSDKHHHLLNLMKWPSLSTVHIYLCPKLRRPPFGAECPDIFLNDEMDNQMTKDYVGSKRKDEEKEKEEG